MEFTVYLLFPFAGTDDAISSYIKSVTDDYKLEFLKNLQLYNMWCVARFGTSCTI